jgi:transposase InsO family protein
MDTIHVMQDRKTRIYVYTLIDLYSRWSFAQASEKIGAVKTVDFVKDAQLVFPHEFTCLQSDHGPEFSQRFTDVIKVRHRHSRVRKPNDNAHIERFNRTIQDEFLDYLPRDVSTINHALPEYLKYYNEERLHLGIEMKTPIQMLNETL